MLTTHPRPGIFATMHRLARFTIPAIPCPVATPRRSTTHATRFGIPIPNSFGAGLDGWGRPANFPPPDALTATAPLNVPDHAVPASLVRLGPYWVPYLHDPLWGLVEPERTPYRAQRFERRPGAAYVTRFVRGISYVDSPDSDDFYIRHFDKN